LYHCYTMALRCCWCLLVMGMHLLSS
jgi:hypothetical protein